MFTDPAEVDYGLLSDLLRELKQTKRSVDAIEGKIRDAMQKIEARRFRQRLGYVDD